MSEDRLRWVIAGLSFFLAAAYFFWLVSVYARYQQTDKFVRQRMAEWLASQPAGDNG